MDFPPTEYQKRPRKYGKWRCGACLFELSDDIDTLINIDVALDETFAPNCVDNRDYWVNKWAFHSSVERGCKICQSLVSIINLSRDRITPPQLTWRRGILLTPDDSKYQIFLTSDQDLTAEELAKFHPYLSINSSPSGDTGSSLAFERAASWLGQCLKQHEVCAQRSTNIEAMPQRIIFIDDYATCSARLIDDTTQMTPQPYLCLSHRWTLRTRASSLTRDRVKSFREAIPKEFLYPLFVNVFEVTQRLGYQYIWIDSLCICQDDLDDWHKQSSHMAAIYENANITISAVSAELQDGNIFSQSSPKSHKLCAYNGRDIFIRRVDNVHPFKLDYNPFSGTYLSSINSEYSPLLWRGWVYQEWLLSRRILYFTPNELILECRQSLRCECGSEEEAWHESKARCPTVSKMNWLDICHHHSRTGLSYPSDRLPALSGIARRFGEARGWTYLAGLWREDTDFVRLLMWSAERPAARPTVTNRLPSWSWASINSPIAAAPMPFGQEEAIACQIIDHDVLPGPNPYGVPKFAKLVVQGPCITATLEYTPPRSGALDKGAFYLFLQLAELIAWVNPDYSFEMPGVDHVASGKRVLLLICSFSANMIKGIVLKSVGTTGKVFERIGFATCSFSESPQRMPERLQSRWTIREFTLI